jgi:hypothetical protein
MPSVFTQARLQQLRSGDRVTYGGVQWQVMDYSTYEDDEDYGTAEWLLRSPSGKEHYLLREVDPQDDDTDEVNWYFSEEISLHQVSGMKPGDDIRFGLWDAMRDGQPYHQLRALGRVFTFESQTMGNYRSDRAKESRTTWDYWDADHTWNLALEAWQDGVVRVYSTKPVQPAEFSDVERSVTNLNAAAFRSSGISLPKSDRTWQWIGAWTLIILGLLLMLFGGW